MKLEVRPPFGDKMKVALDPYMVLQNLHKIPGKVRIK